MEKFRGISMLFALAAVATFGLLPCLANENNENAKEKKEEKSIFDVPKGREPETWKLELSGEENKRLLDAIRKRDTKKAREIEALRKKDPDKFRSELRRHARSEYDTIIRERVERWFDRQRERRQKEFIEWLTKNVSREAADLDKLKGEDRSRYEKRYDQLYRKYARAFGESRDDPEMARVLLEDLKLVDRRDYLISKIMRTRNQRDRNKLIAQLEEVLNDRYDLIVMRKIILYERLLRRLDGLQGWIEKSKTEIEEYKKGDIKDKNIDERIKTLLDGKKGILQ